mgnify:FL=1
MKGYLQWNGITREASRVIALITSVNGLIRLVNSSVGGTMGTKNKHQVSRMDEDIQGVVMLDVMDEIV